MTRSRTLLTATAIFAATCAPGHASNRPHEPPTTYTYSCDLNRAFPASPPDERNPVTDTTVTLRRNRIVVQHTLANGEVKTRNDQYRRDYTQTTKEGEDTATFRWTGKRGSLSMEGIFVAAGEGDASTYSEEQHDDGRLSVAAVWSCSLPTT
jgi:hypothetical protein